jgi:hypothetical protein
MSSHNKENHNRAGKVQGRTVMHECLITRTITKDFTRITTLSNYYHNPIHTHTHTHTHTHKQFLQGHFPKNYLFNPGLIFCS